MGQAAVERARHHLEQTPKTSPHCKSAKIALGRAKGREANRRKDFLHKCSAKIISRAALFATEKLAVKNMTRSAKGTVEKPGTNVAAKAGLNREILATSPSMFLSMLQVAVHRDAHENAQAVTAVL